MILSRETFHQTLAATNVFLNEFMIGIHCGWIAPILAKLLSEEDDITPTIDESSWIASLHDLGRVGGPLFSTFFLDTIGRKYSIIICSFLFFLSWLMMIFTRTILLICLLRIFFGFVQGMNDVTGPIYLAENCTPTLRGIIGSIYPMFFFIGFMAEYIIATYLSYTNVAIANTIISSVAFFTAIFLKETPYFLILKGRNKNAETNLTWLRGNSISKIDIQSELDKIEENVQSEKSKQSSLIKQFTAPENYKTMSIIIIFNILYLFMGISSVNNFSSMTLQPSATFSVGEYLILFGICQLSGSCLTPLLIGSVARRTLMLVSVFIMTTSHLFTFCLYAMDFPHWCEYFPWLIFASTSIFSATFAFSYPITFMIRGEILPMSVKVIGGSLGIVVDSLAAFITARFYLPIAELYGVQYNFLIYAIAGILTFVYVYMMLPETRGKSLIEIQTAMKNKN